MSMPSTQSVVHHVARIEHICCECRGIIAPLDVYERVFGVWDGTPHVFKTCSHCEDARDWLLNETTWKEHEYLEDGADYIFGELSAHLRDLVREFDGRYLFPAYRRTVAMKRRRKAAADAYNLETERLNAARNGGAI